MIRLRTLGTTGLTDASGEELGGVLRQPKRFALLAYLALKRPLGLHRRDTLLPLFWPELDTDRARAALRQSLYKLRRHLPPGVLVTRGDEEVGVEPGIWCDVWAFEAALAAGRPEDALPLYGGELMEGFHLPDVAPELGYWLESKRQRLRGLAVAGAWELAMRAQAADDLDGIRQWATQAVGLAPLDEDGARRLILMLDSAGDRAGAVAAYEQWARRLQSELEVDPAPETVALVESIRQRSEPRRVLHRDPTVRRSLPRKLVPDFGSDRAGESPADRVAIAQPELMDPSPRRRIRVAWGLAVATALMLLVALLPLELSWRVGNAAPSSPRVVILPFAVQGSPELEYLSDGMVYLLSAGLDGQDVRTVDPHSVLYAASAHDAGTAAPSAFAGRFEAGYFVRGNVVGTEGGMRITATVYPRSGGPAVGHATVTGPASELLSLVDELTIELLTTWRVATAPGRAPVLAIGTSSVPALKAYLEGERHLRGSQLDAALSAFREAVREDTLFALAYYRMSLAGSWAFRGDLATWAAEQALRHGERLPQRERLLLEAHSAYRAGTGEVAEDLARRLTVLYPEDPESWYRLAEAIHHFAPLRGRPIAPARQAFERAASLDLLSPESLYHLVQINALLGDTVEARRSARRALTSSPGGARSQQLLLLDALLAGNRNRWNAALADLAAAEDFTIVSAAYSVGVFGGDPRRARTVARLLVEPGRSADTRSFGHLLLASLEMALGRWEAARRELTALRLIDGRRADLGLALLGTLPGVPLSEAHLRGLQLRLSQDPAPAPEAGWWAQAPEVRWLPGWYARVRVAVRLRDEVALEALLAELATLTTDTVLIADLGAGARSEFDHGRGDPLLDIPLPGAIRAAVRSEHAVLSPFISQPARRHLQAALLAAHGQDREALDWFESLASYSLVDLVHGVPALVDRARLHERLGDPEAAAALYGRFLELWADADPAFQHVAGEARDHLRRLTRESSP
jgi:DNA-binding SARP family transcriptional activator/tetratricopeptide (TPR) repeat protein/TolB-like protein